MLKRAWYYITRKKIKSLILILVLFGIGTSLISALSIQKAAAISEKQTMEKIGSGFTISNNRAHNMGNSRGEGNVPEEAVDQIAKLSGVTGYLKRMTGIAEMTNAELVPLENGRMESMDDEKYSRVLSFMGENDSSLDKTFTGGILSLKEGRHLKESDSKKVLVHEAFAEANGLKLGDTLNLKPSVYDSENKNQSNSVIKAEIIGIFTGKNPVQPSMREEMCENTVLTDLDTVRELYGYKQGEGIYQDVTFYAKDSSEAKQVMQEAKKLDIDWRSYELTENGSEYAALGESVEILNGMIRMMLIGTVVVGIIVLSFFLVLWVQGRKKEMGILVSVGISKKKIAGQLLCELLLIGVLSFGLSYFGGQAVADTVGDRFLQQASQESVENLNSGLNGMLGADLESATTAQTLEELDVTIQKEEVIALFLTGMGIIVAATLISTIPVLRKKPREILTQMS